LIEISIGFIIIIAIIIIWILFFKK
jgi:hypothetical protein